MGFKCFAHFKGVQSDSQPCWGAKRLLYLRYDKTLPCQLSKGVLRCHTSLVEVGPRASRTPALTWREYSASLLHYKVCISPALTLSASSLFQKMPQWIFVFVPDTFDPPPPSLWSALGMTSTLVRSAVRCGAPWWGGLFHIPEGSPGYVEQSSLVLIYGPATPPSSIPVIQPAQHFQADSSLSKKRERESCAWLSDMVQFMVCWRNIVAA